MATLRDVVQAIVSDLIRARHDADVVAAELSERYRVDPTMRGMNPPMLNISNVSIDLRFALAEPPPELARGFADEATVDDAGHTLRNAVVELPSVERQVRNRGPRSAFGKDLLQACKDTLARHAAKTPGDRVEAVVGDLEETLQGRSVELAPEDRERLVVLVREAAAAVAEATEVAPSGSSVVVGAEALSKLDARSISSIRFDVRLADAQWMDVDADDDEGPSSILSFG